MKEIRFIKSQDCPLCDQAMELLSSSELDGFNIVEKDVYSKRELHDKYWDKIPVVIKDNKVLYWPFQKEDLDNFLKL